MAKTVSSTCGRRVWLPAIVTALVTLLAGACGKAALPPPPSPVPASTAHTSGAAVTPGVSGAATTTEISGATATPGPAGTAPTPLPAGQWEPLPNMPADLVSLVVAPGNPSLLYAATFWTGSEGGGLYKTADGGLTWEWIGGGELGDPPQRVDALAIDNGTPPTLYADAGGVVFASTDEAQSWSQRGSAGLSWPRDCQLWVAPSNGEVLTLRAQENDTWVLARSPDGGRSWTRLEQSVPDVLRAVALDPTNADILYAGTATGVFKTTDGGRTWAAASQGMEGDLGIKSLAVDPDQPETLYAGRDPGLFKSIDGGKHWTSPEPGVCAGGFCCHPQAIVPDPVASGRVYIVCNGAPGLIVSEDGGANWSLLPLESVANPGVQAFGVSFTPDPIFVWSLSNFGGWRYGPVPLAASSAGQPTSAPAIGTPQALEATAHYRPGDLVNADGLVLSVLGWSSAEDAEAPGFRVVSVDLAVYNPTTGVREVNYFSQYHLQDADGRTYEYGGAGPTGPVGGRLQAGEVQRGAARFQVPEAARGLAFAYRLSSLSEGLATVDLGDQPLTLELPEALRVAQPNSYGPGQVIESGAIRFAALGWQVSQGDAQTTATPGSKVIAVDFVMTSEGDQEITFDAESRIRLQDSSRTPYAGTLSAPAGVEAWRQASLKRGQVARARLLFQVPEESTTYTLKYTASDVSEPAYVELGAEPKLAAVPTDLAALQEAKYGPGEVVENGNLTYSVLGWGLAEGNGASTPGPGEQILLVDLLTVNRGPVQENWWPGATLRDADCWQYTRTDTYIDPYSRESPPRELVRGERVRSTLAFRVATGGKGWVFSLAAPAATGEQAYVALGSEPTSVEVPPALRGPDPNAHQVGETIRQGDTEMVVLGWALSDGGSACQGGATPQAGGSQMLCPAAGDQFLVVGMAVTNRSSRAVEPENSDLVPAIRDATGYRYRTGPYVYVSGSALGLAEFLRSLAPGEERRCLLAYEVPLGSSYELLFDPRWLFGEGAGDRIVVGLGSVPSGSLP